MKKIAKHLTTLVIASSLVSCAGHRGLPAKIIQGNAQVCIDYARSIGDTELEAICETANDLAPLLDLIGRRRVAGMSGPSASASAPLYLPATSASAPAPSASGGK